MSSTDTPGHDTAEPGPRDHGAPARGVEKKGQPWYIEIPLLVVIALALVFVFQTFVGRVYQIPSESMEPTFHDSGPSKTTTSPGRGSPNR